MSRFVSGERRGAILLVVIIAVIIAVIAITDRSKQLPPAVPPPANTQSKKQVRDPTVSFKPACRRKRPIKRAGKASAIHATGGRRRRMANIANTSTSLLRRPHRRNSNQANSLRIFFNIEDLKNILRQPICNSRQIWLTSRSI